MLKNSLATTKRGHPLAATGQLRPDETVTAAAEDCPMRMARIDSIGYDANGRLNVPEDEAPNPPEVREVMADFAQRLEW